MDNILSSGKWSDEILQASRKRMDPLADAFVAELSAEMSEKELFLLMKILLDEYIWIGDEVLNERATQYLNEASALPEWADPELIKKGEEFFAANSFEIAMILMMKALPATYCCWRGAEVVHSSGRLTEHSGNLKPFIRRLMQTSKFVLNVLDDGGLKKDAFGVRSAVKVRTLHAFIRYFLHAKAWEIEKFGAPINQEDYAGTMLSFSVFVIEGMESLGINVTKDEKEAYFHVWKVVAHIVGVEPMLIANTYDEGAILGHAILNHQKGESKSGKELTKACLDFMQSLIPYRPLKFLPNEIMYYLLGPELSKMVSIERRKNPFIRIAFFLFRFTLKFVEFLKKNIGFIRRFAIKQNPKILDAIIRKFLEETQNPFSPLTNQEQVKAIKNSLS